MTKLNQQQQLRGQLLKVCASQCDQCALRRNDLSCTSHIPIRSYQRDKLTSEKFALQRDVRNEIFIKAKGVKFKSSTHEILKSSARQYPAAFPGSSLLSVCPLCDSSVFGYCSHKLIHDKCCCGFPVANYRKPPQCVYYDCRILYAKSCYEHNLIKNCCCQNPHLSFN
uniref:CCC domain-containing protein n=1 Tax=Glossina pallidipes TaxID=7398 RepID=A0A1A9ZLM9_GLOPL